MTALAQRTPEPASPEAVIVGATISAGHDGTAELVVSIRYGNGQVADVVLDGDTGFAVMAACGAADLAGLVGRSWREIFKGLQ